MSETRRNTERRFSLLVLTLIIVLIIVLTIGAILAATILEEGTKQKVLWALLVTLIATGLAAFFFLDYLRKQAVKRRDLHADLWLQQTLEEQRRVTRPTDKSWALTTPWRSNQKEVYQHPIGSSTPTHNAFHSTV